MYFTIYGDREFIAEAYNDLRIEWDANLKKKKEIKLKNYRP